MKVAAILLALCATTQAFGTSREGCSAEKRERRGNREGQITGKIVRQASHD